MVFSFGYGIVFSFRYGPLVFSFVYGMHGLFIWVWYIHCMVVSFGYGAFHSGIVPIFGYGLFIWVWSPHLDMLFSFWVWSVHLSMVFFRSFVSVAELVDSLCRDDVDTPIA